MTRPVDIADRLAIRTLRAGGILHRAHAVGGHVILFGPGEGKLVSYAREIARRRRGALPDA